QGGWAPILRGCAEVTPKCLAQVAPYADTLVAVADASASVRRRVAAIAACSCTAFPAVRYSVPHWLQDPAEESGAPAVLQLPGFTGESEEQALRDRASDTSPKVRAAVGDAIGNGKIVGLSPTLQALFEASVGPTNPLPPLTLEDLKSGGQLSN